MTKITKRIISLMLTLCLLFLATVPTFAAEEEEEEYLSDLRIVYADNLDEATSILEDADLEGYHVFNANLNANTGKKGVWLAFQTSTNIEDAITDIAIMQMNGGYNEGNYQEMIKQSYEEYLEFGENYLVAINHLNKGVDAGHYLSEIAHRQLNFYNVVTEGIDEIPEFEGERLGDIFYNGIDASDLATMFMEGNSYALSNIRSLLAMGVSYNEDGKTYLEKVSDEVANYTADNTIYENEDYNDVAKVLATEILVYKSIFKELETFEPELNYEDEELTDLEIEYMEYMYIAKLMRGTNYLNGKTLYQFCVEYEFNTEDCSSLYPLVAALNEGQLAMTKVNHFYDVVRYSSSVTSSETLDEELAAAEEKYGDNPFNVYTGVDRTIYRDTFALTSAAYRADAFTESGLAAALWGAKDSTARIVNIMGIIGLGTMAATGVLHVTDKLVLKSAKEKLATIENKFFYDAGENYWSNVTNKFTTPETVLDDIVMEYKIANGNDLYVTMTPQEKFDFVTQYIDENPNVLDTFDKQSYNNIADSLADDRLGNTAYKTAKDKYNKAFDSYLNNTPIYYTMYVVGGLIALASAIRLGVGIYNYYHPEYSDIPTAMVDLIETKDGDRYIKYDVVYEAEPQADGTLIAGDLNAFQANRWNAMYYTKSYEAGKPILADEFVVSNTSNVPPEKHMPVHRFGEVVCYNLNKYNFNDDHSIFLSVKQSDKQKSAVADVPEIVGSVFSAGYMILAGGVGLIAGVGGTIGTVEIIKRRKSKKSIEA